MRKEAARRATIAVVAKRKTIAVSAAFVVAVIGGVLAVASAVAASAAGGVTIATAPMLPVGVRVADESRRPEYWRVELGLADRLVVDLGSRNSKLSAEMCVLHYEVNDYSVDPSPCQAWSSTFTKRQLTFTAPAPGSWIVVVYGCGGCYIFRPLAAARVVYEFTARVQRFTRVTLIPAKTRVGRRTTIVGTVEGAASGKVLLTQRSGGRWVPLGSTRLRANGSFSFATTFFRRGVIRIGAMYAGDDRHRPSSGTTTVGIK